MGDESAPLSPSLGIQQHLSSYRETVIRQATAAGGSAVHRDDAPTCGICHKTKFADGCGNLCSYCQTKFCARCGGRVSLRSNTVREGFTYAAFPVI
ncbi:Regulating synaptic membrane exocytosis protein 1 [Ameca splendens]|uniref:Regulating synaptic membrane exocytosis protein 1 n=1 Tax=Ameca splendens TaxID=208324 RepID=A0ABV0Z3G5_9TELE